MSAQPNPLIDSGKPLFFRVEDAAATQIAAPEIGLGDAVRLCVRSLSVMQKEALVISARSGAMWRLASDEGDYLAGLDEAPCPLSFLTTGMVSSYMNEILALEEQEQPLQIFSLLPSRDPRFHADVSRIKAQISYLPDVFEARQLLRYNARAARRNPKGYLSALLQALRRGRPRDLWRLLQAGWLAERARGLRVRHLHAHFATEATHVAALASRISATSRFCWKKTQDTATSDFSCFFTAGLSARTSASLAPRNRRRAGCRNASPVRISLQSR